MNKIIYYFLVFCFAISSSHSAFALEDDLANGLQSIQIEKPQPHTEYNYESFEKVAIHLRIAEKLTTKNTDIYDNQPISLYVTDNVKYKGKTIIHRGVKFSANVSAYMSRGMNGIPATIILENFRAKELDSNKLKGIYIAKGFNLTPLVLPIKWILTPFPGVGSLTNFIVGGNATISPDDEIIIYYYPNWK